MFTRYFVAPLLLALALSACGVQVAGTSVRTARSIYTPTESQNIALFVAARPTRHYQELGVVKVETPIYSGDEKNNDPATLAQLPSAELIDKIRHEAAQLGANAIINLRTYRTRACSGGVLDFLLNTGSVKEKAYVEGVAVRYR